MIAALVPGWLGLSSLVFYAWLLLGRPGLPWLAALQGAVGVAVAILWWRHVRLPAERAAPPSRSAIALLGLAILGACLVTLHVLHAYPDGMWMAVDIWNARAVFVARTDLPTMLASATWHLEYPLLLPLSIGELWAFTGRTRAVPIAVAVLLMASCVALLHAATRRAAGSEAAAAVAVVLLASPWFVVHGAGQEADVPLACFALGATALLWEHDRRPRTRRGLLVWAGVLLGCALWTKNEGLLLALAILGVRGLDRRDGLGAVLLGLAPFALALLHHRVTCGELGDIAAGQGPETLARLLDPARWRTTLAFFAAQGAPYAAVVAALAWLLPARGGALLRGLRAPGLVLAGYFTVFLVTPHDLEFHLESTLERLLLHVWPLALLALGYAAAPTADSKGRAATALGSPP